MIVRCFVNIEAKEARLGLFCFWIYGNNMYICAMPKFGRIKNCIMKKSELSFADGFLGVEANKAAKQGKPHMAFDWSKAAQIIKDAFSKHPDLTAEAGLQGDWDYTGGIIFEDGKPTNEHYTYLKSNWATPTLLLSWDGEEQEEIECFSTEKYTADSKWDIESLSILGIQLE